jgi:DNA (cytosine-5)-methyltransferase 1
MTTSNPSFLGLFSGCGGFDLGFVQAGFRCAGAYDLDSAAVNTHNANFSSSALIRDLSTAHNEIPSDIDVDVVIAGPPCQGFSTVGKRRLNDPRNHLLLTAGRIALEIRPKVFVLENVRGVVSGQHHQYWQKLKTMLEDADYRITDFLADAERIGLAQMRKRMILVAWRTRKGWVPAEVQESRSVLRDVLGDINDASNHNIHLLEPGSDLHTIAKHIKPGQKLSNVRGGARSVHTWDIPEIYGETTDEERRVLESLLKLRRQIRLREDGDADPVLASAITKHIGFSAGSILTSLQKKGYVRKTGNRYDLCHAFNGKFRRLRWDEPSYTVDTRFTDFRYFLHPNEHRGFTVREAARIQGFPDSFVFMGTEKDQARLVGNAVPPPLAHWVALGIRKMLTEK